jgi:hypothetical protein
MGAYTAGDGSVLVISGAGGVGNYPISPSDPEAGYFARAMGQNAENTYGYLRLNVSETVLDAQFVPVSAGPFRDSFRIQADGEPSPSDVLHSQTFTAADGSPWPTGWTSQTVSGVADIQAGEGRLRFENIPNAYARTALTGVPSETNTDLLLSYRWHETSARSYFNVFLRGSGGWQNGYRPLNGYGLELSNTSATVSVRKNVAGTVSNLTTVTNGQQVGTGKQWLRLRVDGSTVAFGIWPDGSPEPTTWAYTGTDTAVTAPGQLYLSLVRSSSSTGPRTVTIDNLTLTRAD